MSFWWVNHKQTHKQEIGGGYIWSPKFNRNGARNQSYDNMPLTNTNDVIFSYADGLIGYVGIVSHAPESKNRPPEFGTIGNHWDENGWLVRVEWHLLVRKINPRDHLSEIVPLLPSKYSPIQTNGNGNQVIYLASINDALGKHLLNISGIEEEILFEIEQVRSSAEEEVAEESITKSTISETEKEQLVKSRIGQGVFRGRVEEIEDHCRVTGLTDKRFLIASHIKPWRLSSNQERLDGNNGLLLSPHIDKLFDLGFVSFTDDGNLLVASESIKSTLETWNVSINKNFGTFTPEQKAYLEFHRSNIFKGYSI